MKLLRFQTEQGPRWGRLEGDWVYGLEGDPYENLREDGSRYPREGLSLLAPCTPSKIVCVGKNYYDHAMELGSEVPDHPILFLKAPNTLNHPEGSIQKPSFVERLDYEGELALVIRKRAKDLKPQEALDYILGYTCLNDVTARDVQQLDGQWTRAKTMDGFCPIGPILTDEVDPEQLEICTRLNGQVKQKSNTSFFMTKLPELMAFITASMTLEPGDVVTTGTPAGIGPMESGDVVEVEIQGIGILRNHVI